MVSCGRPRPYRDSAAVFVQFVDSCLVDPRAKQMWRDLMTAIQYFWRHPPAERERVDACTDLDRLERWAQRAVHVTDAAELFVEE